jgi:hypothetical protein
MNIFNQHNNPFQNSPDLKFSINGYCLFVYFFKENRIHQKKKDQQIFPYY